MNYYSNSVEETLKELRSDINGLTEEEAAKRLQENGENKLKEAKKTSLVVRFLQQLVNPMTIILIVAAAISLVTAIIGDDSFADVIIIVFVVLLNAVLGVVQESKAEKAIEALAEMTKATSKVLRNGKQCVISSNELVVGDVIILEAGDAVPADGRLIEAAGLKVEEAALTGESVAIDKKTERLDTDKEITLGDRKNMVYMGSVVVYGRGVAVITATGMNTEMGKIADALQQAEEGKTPLQTRLNGLSKILSFAVLGICVFIFGFSLLMAGEIDGNVILDTFLIAVSLAVAAIPEGLSTVVTVVLSIGVTRMAKRNAVIRKLTAVEALGSAEIICSDKTGTLTQNKMTVVESYGDVKSIALGMALCSDSELDENFNAVGEPTENALVNFAYKNDLNKSELKAVYPRIGEAPFDSNRKMMSTVHDKGGEIIQFTKGAPDELLKICKFIDVDGKVMPLTESKKSEILLKNKEMAEKALRVLAVGYKKYGIKPADYSAESIENELIFIGLVGMIDPIRSEVKGAIEEAFNAGIKPIMITGDHKITAIAIAKELGILKDESEAITGLELDKISDEELDKRIGEFSVYARVQPEHKVRIVNAWKKNNKITAMTGDGVNDAPSIKSADIGVGMGITGTDVSKSAADMVLADDNFATIIAAVEEGRVIYDNIRKAIQFLLASNLSEVLSIFIATLFGFVILKPVHLLWINLITDTLPALALGLEKAEDDVMIRKPRPRNEGIFAESLGLNVILHGVFVTALVLTAYFIGYYFEFGSFGIGQSGVGVTMAFLTMNMAEIFHSLNLRSEKKSLFTIKKQNKILWLSVLIALVLTTAVIYIPVLREVFSLEFLSVEEYFAGIGLALAIIPLVEITKLIERKLNKK